MLKYSYSVNCLSGGTVIISCYDLMMYVGHYRDEDPLEYRELDIVQIYVHVPDMYSLPRCKSYLCS